MVYGLWLMAYGSGSRLWPLPRAHFPQQFLAINSSQTMLRQTVSRLAFLRVSDSITICDEAQRFLDAERLCEIGALEKIVVKSVGRNKAPAIALAALAVKRDPRY